MHFSLAEAPSFHKRSIIHIVSWLAVYCYQNLNTTGINIIITSHLLFVEAILSFSKNEAATDDARLVGTFTLSDSDCVRFSFRFSLTTVLNEGYYDCGRLNDVDVYK